MNDDILVRPEQPTDIAAIREVNERAFASPDEAKLVEALRQAHAITMSLVAEVDGRIVGHILFSPVDIDRDNGQDIAVGLGPMAVLPDVQRRGIGKALLGTGLEKIRDAGHGAIVVVGHPSYYPRFGFKSASEFGLRWEVAGHENAFFAIELRPGFLGVRPGVVRYRPEFMQVSGEN
jgi:putative acetyltransferase